jgi:AraC-like DNA-binding protein
MKLIMPPAVSLEDCVVSRPETWGGRIELVTSGPALRRFPLHVSAGLGLCWKFGRASHVVIADGRRLSYPAEGVSVRRPGCVWENEANDAPFFSIDIAPELLPEGARFRTMIFVAARVLPAGSLLAQRLRLPATRLARDHALAALFAVLAQEGLTPAGELGADNDGAPQVLRARAFLAEHFADDPTLDDLARHCDANKFSLLRAFKRRFGITPHALQVQLRIEAARTLLARGAPIAEAAAQVGFADQSHFGRHFKRTTGITPREYLRI